MVLAKLHAPRGPAVSTAAIWDRLSRRGQLCHAAKQNGWQRRINASKCTQMLKKVVSTICLMPLSLADHGAVFG